MVPAIVMHGGFLSMVTRSVSAVRRALPRSRFGLLCVLVIVAISTADAAPRALQLDDLSAPLAADNSRDEAAQDRLDALAHFAAGRTLQQRGDLALACRHLARADRLDPASRIARSDLVASAVEGKRYALAARYAVKGIDPDEVGEEALEVLADYWITEGNLTRAIECSEQSLHCIAERRDQAAERFDAEDVAKARITELNVRYALRELYSLAGKRPQAAEQAARVMEVLDHPGRIGIKPGAVATLLDAEPRVVYRALGNAFLMADRFAEAEAAFRKADALAPDKTVLDLNLARIALRRDPQAGAPAQEALAKLQPYLDRHLTSEGAVAYQLLADVLKKLGKEKELLGRLQKLHDADPANVTLSYFLAAEYLKAGKLDLAEPIYVSLAAHGPRAAAELCGPGGNLSQGPPRRQAAWTAR